MSSDKLTYGAMYQTHEEEKETGHWFLIKDVEFLRYLGPFEGAPAGRYTSQPKLPLNAAQTFQRFL